MTSFGTDAPATIAVQAITGLVLAGGRGSRMGDADKGLVHHDGQPLALHALQRLAPQVGKAAVSANRNLPTYAAFGVPVWPDSLPDRPGPLAGVLSGLQHCATPYLAIVPCDAPEFPLDLVRRLAATLTEARAEIAVAAVAIAGRCRLEPVFCLIDSQLGADLSAFMDSGGHRVRAWIERHTHAVAVFDSPDAFANMNTVDDLRRASRRT